MKFKKSIFLGIIKYISYKCMINILKMDELIFLYLSVFLKTIDIYFTSRALSIFYLYLFVLKFRISKKNAHKNSSIVIRIFIGRHLVHFLLKSNTYPYSKLQASHNGPLYPTIHLSLPL